jgi:hypothetical protein
MSQGQNASVTKICNLVRLPASVAKYASGTSPQESWTISQNQITKPMLSGSQTLHDQLHHHFGTANAFLTQHGGTCV